MKMYSKNLIEYKIENPIYYDVDSSNFTSFVIDNIITLGPLKFSVDSILKVQLSSNILSTRTIKTPKGTSLEGFSLTGYKAIIFGECILKIQYTSYNSSIVYSISSSVTFVESIVLDEAIAHEQLYPYIIIEDALIEKIDDCILNFSCSLSCLI